MNLKVCVYTIAKNEESFVRRWSQSCADADYRIICDTGSTDGTVAIARECGVIVHEKKFDVWRFDDARNWSLNCIPEDVDVCISLDMDEVLLPGWRKAIESMKEGVTRPRYKYVWSWNSDGSEGLVYGGDKIHSRNGYKWVHPVHEVLMPEINEVQEWIQGLEIHHHPDSTKSRSQYLPLLELAVKERPEDDRNQFYLAREYFYKGVNDLASNHFKIHLNLSNWAAERAAGCRFLSKTEPWNREKWLHRAIYEDHTRRENWVELAQYYHDVKNWHGCLFASLRSLEIKEKPLDYLCEADAWSWQPHDLVAISSYWLGMYKEAFKHGKVALSLDNKNSRLESNLRFYEIKI